MYLDALLSAVSEAHSSPELERIRAKAARKPPERRCSGSDGWVLGVACTELPLISSYRCRDGWRRRRTCGDRCR